MCKYPSYPPPKKKSHIYVIQAFAWLESFYASEGENYRSNPKASERYRKVVRKGFVQDTLISAPASDLDTFYKFLTKDYMLAVETKKEVERYVRALLNNQALHRELRGTTLPDCVAHTTYTAAWPLKYRPSINIWSLLTTIYLIIYKFNYN